MTLNQFSVIGGLRVDVRGVEECCRQCTGESYIFYSCCIKFKEVN